MENSNTINIFELADSFSALNPRFTVRKKKCRQAFQNFMEANNYFGIQQTDTPFYVKQSDAEKIRSNIELWILSYASGDDDKLSLLSKRLTTLFPETGELFAGFIAYTKPKSSIAWKLLDYLCFAMKCEIAMMSAEELDCFADDMDKALPLFSAQLFSEFLIYAAECGVLSNGPMYQFKSRGKSKNEGAYATMDFLKMAHIVFNDESWKSQGLLEKALQSERDANLWLFVSCHFICGWRGTDIVRLPMPTLPADMSCFREQIETGCFQKNMQDCGQSKAMLIQQKLYAAQKS